MTREVPIEYKVNRAANSPDTQRHQLNRILEDIREKLESAGLSGDYVTQQELEAALAGLDLGGKVDVVVGGVAISVNSSNPAAPVVSVDISGLVSTDVGNTLTVGTDGGLFTSTSGGQVDEVIAGDHVNVDSTDPTKPIVSVPISGGPPNAGDPVVSNGSGGLEWGSSGGGGSSSVIVIRDVTTVSGSVSGASTDKFRAPVDFSLHGVKASLTSPSSSGSVQIDIDCNGASIFGASKLTIDQGEKTSKTASSPAIIATNLFQDDDEIDIVVDSAGSGASGLRVYMIGTRVSLSSWATWNPLDKSADIVLSNANLRADNTANTGPRNVRATKYLPAGKTYIEFVLAEFVDINLGTVVGLADSALSSSQYVGQTTGSWGLFGQDGQGSSFVRKYHNSSIAGGTGGLPGKFQTGAVVGMAVDMGTGHLWWAVDGIWIEGNPAAGTGASYTNLSGFLYPAASMYRNVHAWQIRTNPSEFSFPAPAGFTGGLPA